MSGLIADRDGPADLTPTMRRALTARIDDVAKTPDLITPDARGALMTYAHGGRKRLHMLVATALFLAEKEQRPRVDLTLVQRAAALHGSELPALPERHALAAPSFWESRGPALAAGVLLGVMAVLAVQRALFTPSKPVPVAATVTHAAESPPAPPPKPVVAAPAAAPKPVQAAVQPQSAVHAEVKPAKPVISAPVAAPAVAVVAPPAPPAVMPPPILSQSRTAAAWRPTAPAPNLVLRYSADTNASLAGARAVTATLERSGFTVTQVPQSMPGGAQASLHYFYAEDAKTADRVRRALYLGYTKPVFVFVGRHQTPPAPGTIELFLP
jgi:hypothetical protein